MYPMLSTNQELKSTSELDLRTIRERVAAIKQNWTPAEAEQRAREGRQRRKQLEALILAMEADCEEYECSLVC
jgi:transglutaminase/protease-like cytokinesis protein 3